MNFNFRVFVLIFLFIVFASANPKQSFKQVDLIKQILIETRFVDNIVTLLNQQIQRTQELNPTIPNLIISKMKNEIDKDKIYQEVIRVWGDIYSESELQNILVFVKTPTGKKFFITQPLINDRQTGLGSVIGIRMYQHLHQYDPKKYPLDDKMSKAIESMNKKNK